MAIRERTTTENEDCESWADEENEDNAGRMITDNVRRINEWQRWRRTAAMRWSELYAGHPDGDGVTSGTALAGEPTTTNRNVIAQAVDTVGPKVSKHRPMPQVLTNLGEWFERKRAKTCNQYLEGWFDKNRIWPEHWPQMNRDGLIYGDGNLRVERWGRTTLVDRVLWWEYLIDSFDGREGKPRFHYYVQLIDLGLALARYGKRRAWDKKDTKALADARCEAIINGATSSPDPNWEFEGQVASTVKRVRLVHAWHICDDEDAHARKGKPLKHECNGRRATVVLLNDELLNYEQFTWKRAPIFQQFCRRPLLGSRGVGLAKRLEGWQERITTQEDKNDEAFRISGGVALFCQSGAGVVQAQISNEAPLLIVDYDGGVPPQVQVLPTCDPMQVQREEGMQAAALSELGISMQSAGGEKHPGLTAAVAIEAIDDIEDEHWIPMGRSGEDVMGEIGEAALMIESEIAALEGEDSPYVQVKMNEGILTLKWSDVSLNDYQVRTFPSSMLPQQPAARFQRLWDFFNAGICDRQTFLQQIGTPDLAAEFDLVTAGRVAIDEMLELIAYAESDDELNDAADQAQPSAYLDYKWMMARAQQWIWKAKRGKAPEQNIQALRDVCDSCQQLILEYDTPPAAPPMMGPPGMGGPPPPGAPMMGAGPAGPASMGPQPGGPPMGGPMPMGNA